MEGQPAKMDDATHQRIERLSADGVALLQSQSYIDAKGKFLEALRLLPEPHTDWVASTWLYAHLGDAHFHLSNFEKCFRCFSNAVQCPDGVGNPFIHLRLGQAQFELGNMDAAADELARAYMGGGMGIMLEDDYKYMEFLETRIDL